VGSEPPGLEALRTEASFRQFYRIKGTNEPLVLMDSPPDKEQNPQFVAVAQAFASEGIRVPRVLAHNAGEGWLLLTDLGRTHFIDAYRAGNEQDCLQAALATLKRISAVQDPVIPDYTAQRLSDELDIFVDWLIRDACNLALPDRVFEGVRKLLLANAADQEQVCVHRDFHCKKQRRKQKQAIRILSACSIFRMRCAALPAMTSLHSCTTVIGNSQMS